MITAQTEKVEDHLNDPVSLAFFKTVFKIHWEELALNKDKIELNPQYQVYLDKERKGELFVATAREEGRVIGYFIGFIGRSLHYADMVMCTPDIYYVHPSARFKNAGTILFNFVKAELKRRGVQYWVVGDKNHKSLAAFFELHRFKKIENYYSMWIGD